MITQSILVRTKDSQYLLDKVEFETDSITTQTWIVGRDMNNLDHKIGLALQDVLSLNPYNSQIISIISLN